MRACACESRAFTLAYRMNVNAMRTGRQLRYLDVEVQYTARQNPAGMMNNRRIGMSLLRNLGPFAGLLAAYSRARSRIN